MLEARLGLAPWDVLHQGIAGHSPLSFGEANMVVGVAVLGLAWRLGAQIGIGTMGNALLVGAFVQLLDSLRPVVALAREPLATRAGLLTVGLALVATGSGLYLGASLGAGPRDSLMVVGARHTSLRVGAVRSGIELSVLIVGAALGGTVGVGTIAFALGIGPLVELSFWVLARSPLAHRRPLPARRVRLSSGNSSHASDRGPVQLSAVQEKRVTSEDVPLP